MSSIQEGKVGGQVILSAIERLPDRSVPGHPYSQIGPRRPVCSDVVPVRKLAWTTSNPPPD